MFNRTKTKHITKEVIFIISIEELNHSNFEAYEHCLKEDLLKNSRNVIAFGAKFNKLACGAIFAQEKNLDEYCIKSFFVLPLFRKRGAGSALLKALSEKLKDINAKKVTVQAITSKENIDLLNDFLTKRGFADVEILTIVYTFDPKKIVANNRFVKKIASTPAKLPKNITICPKSQVSKVLLENLKNKENIDYPSVLSPFANEFDLIDECTQFAIFDDKEIVGWITGLKAPGNMILYRSLFSREDFRKAVLGYFLFNEAIRIHVNKHIDKKILFAVDVKNTRAQKFFLSYLKNLYDSKKFEFKITSYYVSCSEV